MRSQHGQSMAREFRGFARRGGLSYHAREPHAALFRIRPMSEEFGVDLDEVFKVIDSADVLVVRFHLIQKRLLVDFRTKPGIGPFLAIVPSAESVEDRFQIGRAHV